MRAVSNQRGQFVIEAVLLMIVFVAIMALVANSLKQNQVVARIVQGPWQQLAGMFQNGLWAPQTSSQPFHPSTHPRHISLQGDSAR